MDQLVIWLHRVLHVEILSRGILLLEHGRDHILQDGPTVLQVQVDLVCESIRFDADKADDVMGFV